MKKLPIFLISSIILLLSFSCSKQTGTETEPTEDVFSFTYNGKVYRNTPANLLKKVNVNSGGIPSIQIHRADLFGGDIYFDSHNCAYLAPEFNKITIGENCMLVNHENGQPLPIDPIKVYTYQSGFLDITISDCTSSTLNLGFGSVTITTCKASGTFELTLVNQNNETIEITNGIINNFSMF